MLPAQRNALTTAMLVLDVSMNMAVALKVNLPTMLTAMLIVLLLSKQPKMKMVVSSKILKDINFNN